MKISENTAKMTTLKDALGKIRERADKATPGPWLAQVVKSESASSGDKFISMNLPKFPNGKFDTFSEQDIAGWNFIAHARTDIPKLLRVIDKLIQQRDGETEFIMPASSSAYTKRVNRHNQELTKILTGEEE